MKKLSLIAALSGVFFIIIFLSVIITQAEGVSWSNVTIFKSLQGDYVKYNASDPYCLSIIKQKQSLSSKYIIMVSMKNDNNYGHVLNYPEADVIDEKNIEKTKVLWTSDGIELSFNTGHKMFIPKDAFIKGR